jgi:hypothetical protein
MKRMKRAKRRTPPATPVEIARRIRHMLRLMPMSADELRDQVVIHEADASLFEPALREARATGVVVRDSRRRDWLRLA